MSRDVPALLGLRVRREKVVDYPLDPAHPAGGPKAAFLMRFGFTAAQPTLLVDHFTRAPHARTTIDAAGATRVV